MATSTLEKRYWKAGIWTAGCTLVLAIVGVGSLWIQQNSRQMPIIQSQAAVQKRQQEGKQTVGSSGTAVQESSDATIGNASRSNSSDGDTILSGGNGNTVMAGRGSIVSTGDGNIVNSGSMNISSAHKAMSDQEDARQRLHDSGIDYSEDRFYSAIERREVDVLAMFIDAGMRLTPSEMDGFVGRYYDQASAEALGKVDESRGCPTDAIAAYFYADLTEATSGWVKRVCSNETVRARLQQTIDDEWVQLNQARAADEANIQARQKDIRICEQAAAVSFGAHADPMAVHERCRMQATYPPPQATDIVTRITSLHRALKFLGGE